MGREVLDIAVETILKVLRFPRLVRLFDDVVVDGSQLGGRRPRFAVDHQHLARTRQRADALRKLAHEPEHRFGIDRSLHGDIARIAVRRLEVDVEAVVAVFEQRIADRVGVFAAGRFAGRVVIFDETPEGALLLDRPGVFGGRTAVAAVAHDEGEEHLGTLDLLDIAHVLHAVAVEIGLVLPQGNDVQTVGQPPQRVGHAGAGAHPAGIPAEIAGVVRVLVVAQAGVISGRMTRLVDEFGPGFGPVAASGRQQGAAENRRTQNRENSSFYNSVFHLSLIFNGYCSGFHHRRVA